MVWQVFHLDLLPKWKNGCKCWTFLGWCTDCRTHVGGIKCVLILYLNTIILQFRVFFRYLQLLFSVYVVCPCNRLLPSWLHRGGTLQRGCEQRPALSHSTTVADSKGGTVEPHIIYFPLTCIAFNSTLDVFPSQNTSVSPSFSAKMSLRLHT